MANLSQQLVDIGQTNINTVMRLATISFDRTERLMQLQTELASEFLRNSSALQPGAFVDVGERSADLQQPVDSARRCLELALNTQAELSQMWNEQLDALSRGLSQSLEQWIKAITAGSDETIAALQNLTARTNELAARMREQAEEVASRVIESGRELAERSAEEARASASRAGEEARDAASKAKKSKSA